jgi:hypothetical protein
MSAQPSLSRELVFVKLSELNVTAGSLVINRIAFIDTPGTSPSDPDWLDATVTTKDAEDALAVMIGPTRGDTVDTEPLADGDYQVWIEVSESTAGERVVRPCGIHSINPMGVET